MHGSLLKSLGEQLRRSRVRAGLTQLSLARRVGRSTARISELERELIASRWGRDRLTLVVEICDALGLEPVLVPRAQSEKIRALLDNSSGETRAGKEPGSAFDDLFVDLDVNEQD